MKEKKSLLVFFECGSGWLVRPRNNVDNIHLIHKDIKTMFDELDNTIQNQREVIQRLTSTIEEL